MMSVVLAVGLIPLPAFATENGPGEGSAQLTAGLVADGSQNGELKTFGSTALRLGTEDADYVISSKPIVITSSNSSQYNGKTITGTLEAQCTSDAFSAAYLDNSGQRGAIIVDGVEVSLTISDLSVKATTIGGENTTVSPIMLVNGATLNLNLEGTNALTASYGGAGIYVPQGCTLIVNSTDNGSLTATGGDFGPYAQNGYAGGAGIGGAAKTKKDMEPSVGSITIASGNVIAKGGGTTNYGAAGIGGTSTCSAGYIRITGGTVTATGGIFAAGIGNGINGTDALHSGSININGGTVTATGDESAAGIGGGAYDSVSTISITGGTVSATSRRMGCAIGSGYGREYMGTVTSVPSVSITGGNVTADGNIGHPTTGDYAAGGSFTLGDSADVSCTGEVTYDSATKHTINVTVYDPTITTALNDQPATLTLGNTVPVPRTASVTTAGVASFTVQKIVDYGSADSKTVSATAKIGNTTFPAASNVLTKSSKTCNVYVGYRLHLTGTIFDASIIQGNAGTVKISETTIQDAVITCTEGKAVIEGWLSVSEDGVSEDDVVADDSDYSATVAVTIGGVEYNIGSVVFKKTSAHQKTGAFQQGQDSIDYVDENGATQTSTGFTRLENNTTALDANKWYAVFPGETITLNQGLSVGSDVHLILGDGATLNANAGIIVNAGSKLTIYSQSANTGALSATGKDSSAGIGGSSGQSAGTIEIYGGTITASGNDGGAGIGGGKGTTNHTTGKSGTITIGGQAKDVEATGSKGAAGIGGGRDGDGQAITITAGTVRATGATDGNAQAQGGAGIGGGARTDTGGSGSRGGTVTISGSADVTAKGGNGAAGIGGGSSYDVAYPGQGGTITISDEANVKATGGDFGAGIGSGYYGALSDITINGGTVNATGGNNSAGIGQGQSSRSIAVSAGSIIIKAGDITA